ncbi:MAG TPA: hypothetical protein VGC29_07650 [Flavisolibacter sp.]
MEDNYDHIDEAMVPLHEQIIAMLEIEDGTLETEIGGFKMSIEAVGIESPVQLDVLVNGDGSVTLGSSPPLYYVETGVLPVFHNIRFNAIINENEDGYES